MAETYVTSGAAARRLGIAKKTLLRAMHRGAIAPAFQTPGGYFRFRATDVEAYARALNLGPPQSAELQARRADGSWCTVEAIGANCLEDPAVAGSILTGRDVIARGEATAALRASEERLRTLVEHLPTVTYIAPPGGESGTIYLSPQIEQLLGYTVAEWTADPLFWATRLHPDDRAPVLAADAELQNPGAPLHAECRYLARDGRVVWVQEDAVLVRDATGHPLYILGMMLDITARKEAESALRHQALHDALTGLPNRVLLQDRVEQALRLARREHTGVALLLLDLDRFKEVNDTFGHYVGDLLLQEVAGRLQGVLREADTVARLGGDEFAFLLTGVDHAGARSVAHRVRAALEEPMQVGEHALLVDGSVGIALGPEHGADMVTLLQHADVAMYLAKARGEGLAVYAPEQDSYTPDRLALLGELRAAITDGALQLHYQPKVALASRQVVGVEALVRWVHPQRGLVRPDQFIPLAEHTGLIAPLTLWVLEEAVRQCQCWAEQGRAVGVAVNLSARNLQDPQFPAVVAGLLERSTVPPGYLTLEITESALMADPVRAQLVVTRLKHLGVRLSIDDFGTGYSSLGYLKQLPVDEVKIDQSFVRGMGAAGEKDTAIVRSVIDLGHNLGLAVVAEGVEDQAMWQRLHVARCDVAQGYYLGRPVPAADLEHWLDAAPWGGARMQPSGR